jgi:hypothetical protein
MDFGILNRLVSRTLIFRDEQFNKTNPVSSTGENRVGYFHKYNPEWVAL